MKRLLLIPLLACFGPLSAQITITSADMPSSGDTLRYSTPDLGYQVDVTQTGPNFNWDFTDLEHNNQDIEEYVAASQTPYAFFFFGSYGLPVADTLNLGILELTDVYTFFNNSPAAYTAEGAGLGYNGFPLPNFYNDEDEIFTFPLEYGDYDSTTYEVEFSLTMLLTLFQQGSRVNEVDGWGNITTPYGSFDCLRVKSTLYERDSIVVSGIGTSIPVTRQEYRWMANNEPFPILEVTGSLLLGQFQQTQVRYRDIYRGDTIISVPPVDPLPEITLYPNPATDQFTVDGWSGNASLTVTDLQGRVVRQTGPVAAPQQLADLPRGHYLVTVKTEGGQVVQKVVVE